MSWGKRFAVSFFILATIECAIGVPIAEQHRYPMGIYIWLGTAIFFTAFIVALATMPRRAHVPHLHIHYTGSGVPTMVQVDAAARNREVARDIDRMAQLAEEQSIRERIS